MRRSRVRSPSSPPLIPAPRFAGFLLSFRLVNIDFFSRSVVEKEQSVDKALREAQAFFARGDIEQAHARCAALVQQYPSHAGAHNFFAIVEFQRGDSRHALALIDHALSIAPRDPDF